ncbi:MAG TPA: DUF5132 domain-containing protein [Chloroflexota bacterium]|nr:DUF5132 domain-containing protein [Chloroflexota bacterium]
MGTFALGVSAALVARALAPAIGRWARPAVRTVIKQGIILSEGAQVRAAELREDLEDLVAEARAETRSPTDVSKTAAGPGDSRP